MQIACLDYDNFNIRIENKREKRYPVYVWTSSGSISQHLCDNILSAEWEEKFACFDQNKCSREELKEVGTHLFNCLFRDTVLNRFNAELGKVEDNESKGLRIRLIIEATEIADLPWELLYDPDPVRNRFLATWTKTPVTRYLTVSPGNRQLTIDPPVRVLVAIPGFTGLKVEREEQIVRAAFADLEKKKLVELEFMKTPVAKKSILKRLAEGPPFHIFHFIGHGCFKRGEDEGYLLVNPAGSGEDSDVASKPPKQIASDWLCGEDFAELFLDDALEWLSAELFAELFANHPSMKLIVLNSCQGAKVSSTRPLAGVVPRLFGREIPAVVAMQYPISDTAALRFSESFYHSLCNGYERGLIDVAITSARHWMRIEEENKLDFVTPVLFMRSDSGAIFNLKEKEPTVPTNVAGEVMSQADKLWRGVTDPLRLLNDAPRLSAVGKAQRDANEAVEVLIKEKKKKLEDQKREIAALERELEEGRH